MVDECLNRKKLRTARLETTLEDGKAEQGCISSTVPTVENRYLTHTHTHRILLNSGFPFLLVQNTEIMTCPRLYRNHLCIIRRPEEDWRQGAVGVQGG